MKRKSKKKNFFLYTSRFSMVTSPAATITKNGPSPPTVALEQTPTTITTTTTMAPSTMGNAGIANAGNPTTKKPRWRRRTVHFTVFLAVFSTILSLLWIYTITAEIRYCYFINYYAVLNKI